MSSSAQVSGQTTVSFQTSFSTTTAPATRVFNLQITSDAQAYYIAQMSIIQHALLDNVECDSNGNVGDPPVYFTSETDAANAINAALQSLDTWSQMISVDSSGNQTTNAADLPSALSTSSTMTRYMASDLDTLERTLASAGITPLVSGNNITSECAAIETIRSDDVSTQPIYDVRSIIASALSDASNAQVIGKDNTQSTSLQQLLMVDYIATGNEVLYNQMTSLQDAINLNQNVLSYLNSLQDLMNQKTPDEFLMQLTSLNSSSPDYSTFEQATFGQQVIGTTADFTDDQLTKYLALLTAQSNGTDLTTQIASIEYGFGGPSTDAQRIELFQELVSGGYLTTSSATIPDNVISGYTPTTYDKNLWTNYCTAVNAGADITDPAVQVKYGLTDVYTGLSEYISENSLVYDPSSSETDCIQNGDCDTFLENAGLIDNPPSGPASFIKQVLSTIYQQTQSVLSSNQGLDPRVATETAMAQLMGDGGFLHAPFSSGLMNSYLTAMGSPLGLTALVGTGNTVLGLINAGTINAGSQVSDMRAAFSNNDVGIADPASTTSYGDLLGDNSVEVLINLQKAGLLDASSVVSTGGSGSEETYSFTDAAATTEATYGLTPTDATNFGRILAAQAAGLDPTESSVQTEYGITVTGGGGANIAAGTSPAAFVNVISGQYGGSNGIGAIITNLQSLISLAKSQIGGSSATSLVSELTTILGDFQSIQSSGGGVAEWVTNFTDNAEGSYQTNLNNAVVASQSLNDTQRENLQQVMFVYQQFYQSATSMLSSLMTLMQTIASNIASS